MAIKIGPFQLANSVIAAPMAGVSDKPYRKLCREYGAAMTVSEMVTSKLELRESTKSRFRMDLAGEPEPIVVQIVGTEPHQLAAAAQFYVDNGAQIIDINMGCPAKKVCKKAAGSALLEDEPLVKKILEAVANSVAVPVTLKIRTGANPEARNALNIAKIAEQAGVQCLTIHGRTRQCKFVGAIEYDTIAAVKNAVSIPIIANGDICTPRDALNVMTQTGSDAIMIGRAAQGQPWLFQQITAYLENGEVSQIPSQVQRANTIVKHISAIHQFYGPRLGVRFARKHIKWYLQNWENPIELAYRRRITATDDANLQLDLLTVFLESSHRNFVFSKYPDPIIINSKSTLPSLAA
ncbi:MAG: tRNA-dihydrouridine synthase B [Arenicella sp.]|jgi:tRNA-dihydrouridine synthase B